MTKDDLERALGAVMRGRASDFDRIMPVFVEFVADWIEHCTDRLITGYDADVLLDAWREEMGA